MKWIKKVSSTPLDDTAKVIDTLDTQENDRKNAPSIHAVREAMDAFLSAMYPVGSIYLTISDATPGFLGFPGVWEKVKDKYILASGDTRAAGTTGGSNYIDVTPSGSVGNHTLTTSEIPAHDHYYSDRYIDNVSHNMIEYSDDGQSVVQADTVNAIHFQDRTPSTGTTGGGGAHNHTFTGGTTRYTTMPEYFAVNVWKRIG